MKVELPEKVYNEIKEYCQVNNIDDVDKFIRKILNQGFATEKWGVIGENKEPKKEIVEKIIVSAVTSEPKIIVVEKIVYSGISEPEIKFVEKIVVSAITNEVTKFVNTGESINYLYNIYVRPEKVKKEITPVNNTDLYGERNIRKV